MVGGRLSRLFRANDSRCRISSEARASRADASSAPSPPSRSPGNLTDFSPLYCEPDGSNLVTQFDKDDVEAVGLVKFDFLGLRTLTIIDWALKTVNAQLRRSGQPPIDITTIPVDDPQAFTLLKSAETTAVFQLESAGMKKLISKLQPDSFEDITALVALFRPGPLQSGMVDDFINRKHGRAEVDYFHPDLEQVLTPTAERRDSFCGLLSIGEEPSKGSELIREAHELLKDSGLNFAGNVEGRDVIIFDDMIDTAGTITDAARACDAHGAVSVNVCATHALFSGQALERLNDAPIRDVVVSNTLPFDRHDQCPKVHVLDMAPLLADAIERIHLEKTVSALFL
mgnify:CR=1 FL=1